jgi:hypothetical protein
MALAMALAGEHIFIGGTTFKLSADDPYAEIEGRRGGVLSVFSAANGEKLHDYKLDNTPVFDGLIAANNGIYFSSSQGNLVFYKK